MNDAEVQFIGGPVDGSTGTTPQDDDGYGPIMMLSGTMQKQEWSELDGWQLVGPIWHFFYERDESAQPDGTWHYRFAGEWVER